MRLCCMALLALGIVPGATALPAADEPNIGELTRELKGEKPLSERTPEALEKVYLQVLDALLPDLGAQDPGKRGSAQGTIERIAFRAGRPGAEAERAACSKAIAARGPGANETAKVWLLRQLERIGRGEAVAGIARLLSDRDPVRDSARRALQKIPAPEAGAALRAALASADGPAWRAAIINALGERREPSSLDVLKKEAAADHDDVRTAAVIALAKLGDASAAGPIAAALEKGSPRARAIAADSYLLLADGLAGMGEKAAALEIYRKFLGGEAHRKCAALIGIGRTGGAGDLPVLLGALADPDPEVRDACVEALARLPGPDVTASIGAQAGTSGAAAKAGLLRALARRGDKAALPVLAAAAGDADEAVRAAALAGLGGVGDPSMVPLLAKAAATGGAPQEAARRSLRELPGKDIDEALVKALGEGDPKVRVEVIRAIAARRAGASARPLLRAAEDADGSVRVEALRALGILARSRAIPRLTALILKSADDATRNEAATALAKIAGREADLEGRSAPILEALASSSGPARLALLGVLGRIGGAKSLDAVRAALKDGDEKVREAAVRALAEWSDASAAENLLAVAKGDFPEALQQVALRGFIRVVRLPADRPASETAKLLAAGLAAAKRKEEKREALAGLAEVRDLLALQAVLPLLADESVKGEAASAATRIGREIWRQHPEAVAEAMRKAIAVSGNDNVKREAKEALERAERKLKEAAAKK